MALSLLYQGNIILKILLVEKRWVVFICVAYRYKQIPCLNALLLAIDFFPQTHRMSCHRVGVVVATLIMINLPSLPREDQRYRFSKCFLLTYFVRISGIIEITIVLAVRVRSCQIIWIRKSPKINFLDSYALLAGFSVLLWKWNTPLVPSFAELLLLLWERLRSLKLFLRHRVRIIIWDFLCIKFFLLAEVCMRINNLILFRWGRLLRLLCMVATT